MSSKEEPFGSSDRTIIRASSGQVPQVAGEKPRPATGADPASGENPDATVFDPGIAQSPPPGWSSGTVIYQGALFAENATTANPRRTFMPVE